MARVREFRRAGAKTRSRLRLNSCLGRGFWVGEVSFLPFCGRKASFGWGPFLAFPAEILGGKGFKKGGGRDLKKEKREKKIKKAEWQRFLKSLLK